MSTKALIAWVVFSTPSVVQVFLLLCQAVGMISWPGWLLWSPLILWFTFLIICFFTLIIGAIVDGGGQHKA